MSNYRKIPVIRNSKLVISEGRAPRRFKKLYWVFLVFAAMLFHISLRVETDIRLREIRLLETQLGELNTETEMLRAVVVRLSAFERIQRIAQHRLGLEFVSDEQIIQIPAQ